MKKLLLILSIMLFSTSLFSQVSIGFTVGCNLSKVKKEVDYESNPALIVPEKETQKTGCGLIIGVPIEIAFSKKIALYSAITYHQKINKSESSYYFFDSYNHIDVAERYNYLELPIQAKYYFVKRTFGLYVLFGPSAGCLINGNFKLDGYTDDGTGEITYITFDRKIKWKDLKNSGIKRFDLGLVLGGGISYKAGKGDFFLNINYNHGLINMVDGDEYDVYKGVTIKNRGVNVTCGYLIPLSR
ncbi:MAG: PorT family protein [Bacteroidales bacterium]|nr:PorT family protein [Bacteroidales bacterium]